MILQNHFYRLLKNDNFLEKKVISFSVLPPQYFNPTDQDPMTQQESLDLNESRIDIIAKADKITATPAFNFLRNAKDQVKWRLTHDGFLQVEALHRIQSHTPYINGVDRNIELQQKCSEVNLMLQRFQNIQLHQIILSRTANKDDRLIYLKVFGNLSGDEITSELIQQKQNLYNLGGGDAVPYWQSFLAETPLGQIIQNEKGGISSLTPDVLRNVQNEFNRRSPDSTSRLLALKQSVSEPKGIESLEGLPLWLKIAGLAALAFAGVKYPKLAVGVVGGEILARTVGGEEDGLVGVMGNMKDAMFNSVDPDNAFPYAKELQFMYDSLPNKEEKKKSIALSLVMEKNPRDIFHYVSSVVGKTEANGGMSQNIANLQSLNESSLFDNTLDEFSGRDDMKDLKYLLKTKGIKPIHLNQAIYDMVVQLGDGDLGMGMDALYGDKDLGMGMDALYGDKDSPRHDYDHLGDLLWAKAQDRQKIVQDATHLENATSLVISTGESIQDIPENLVAGIGWATDKIINIAKAAWGWTIELKDSMVSHVDVFLTEAGTWEFKTTVYDTFGKAVDVVHDGLKPLLEAVGIAEMVDLDKEVTYTAATPMSAPNQLPPSSGTFYASIRMPNEGSPRYIEYKQYPEEVKSRIDTMRYSPEYADLMKEMAGFINNIDEKHDILSLGVFTNPSAWEWATTGDSGSVMESDWIQMIQLKGREILMVYAHKLNENVGSDLSQVEKEFKDEYLKPFANFLSSWKRKVNTEGGGRTNELGVYWEDIKKFIPDSVQQLMGIDQHTGYLDGSHVEVPVIGWLLNAWGNTIGTLNYEEAENAFLSLSSRDDIDLFNGEFSSYPQILDVTSIDDNKKSEYSKVVYTTYFKIMSDDIWKEVVGFNQTSKGSSIRGYAMAQYFRLVASINEQESINPSASYMQYLEQLHSQFMSIEEYAGGTISKGDIDNLILDTRTYKEFKVNNGNTIRRGIDGVESINHPTESNENDPTIKRIVAAIKAVSIRDDFKDPYDPSLSVNSSKWSDSWNKIKDEIKQRTGLDFFDLEILNEKLIDYGIFFQMAKEPLLGGESQIKVEISDIKSIDRVQIMSNSLYGNTYSSSSHSSSIQSVFSALDTQNIERLKVDEGWENVSRAANVNSLGTQYYNNIIVYPDNFTASSTRYATVLRSRGSTESPSVLSSKIKDDMTKITTANEVGHYVFEKLFETIKGTGALAIYSNKTFSYKGKNWTVHQVNELFSDLSSLGKAKYSDVGGFSYFATKKLTAGSVRESYKLSQLVFENVTDLKRGSNSRDNYLISLDTDQTKRDEFMTAFETEFWNLFDKAIAASI